MKLFIKICFFKKGFKLTFTFIKVKIVKRIGTSAYKVFLLIKY